MFEPLPDLPDDVIGFEAVGEIVASDYADVLMPAISRAATNGQVRMVLVLGPRFAGYSLGAMADDAGMLGHAGNWERTALVSDFGWVNHLATIFGWMVPGRFRRFDLAERDAAIEWAAAG